MHFVIPNPRIWLLLIPGLGINENVRDPDMTSGLPGSDYLTCQVYMYAMALVFPRQRPLWRQGIFCDCHN